MGDDVICVFDSFWTNVARHQLMATSTSHSLVCLLLALLGNSTMRLKACAALHLAREVFMACREPQNRHCAIEMSLASRTLSITAMKWPLCHCNRARWLGRLLHLPHTGCNVTGTGAASLIVCKPDLDITSSLAGPVGG